MPAGVERLSLARGAGKRKDRHQRAADKKVWTSHRAPEKARGAKIGGAGRKKAFRIPRVFRAFALTPVHVRGTMFLRANPPGGLDEDYSANLEANRPVPRGPEF